MYNPMMFGVTPQQMAQLKTVLGEYVGVRLVKDRRQRKISVQFYPKKPEEELARMKVDLGQMVDAWVESMATQLYQFMGIGGEIQDVAD